jgi:hypothetical protein
LTLDALLLESGGTFCFYLGTGPRKLKNLQWGLAPHVSESKDIFLEKDIL